MSNRNFKIEAPVGDMDRILQMAYGGKAPQQSQSLADGGMAQGPSHEEGGVDVVQQGAPQDGPVAEIEGGERVFSIEDTQMIEQACEQINMALQSGDRKSAEDMAMRLGFAVCEMLGKQEQNQQQQELDIYGQGAPAGNQQAQSMNSFGV